jgi:hypothetical protein
MWREAKRGAPRNWVALGEEMAREEDCAGRRTAQEASVRAGWVGVGAEAGNGRVSERAARRARAGAEQATYNCLHDGSGGEDVALTLRELGQRHATQRRNGGRITGRQRERARDAHDRQNKRSGRETQCRTDAGLREQLRIIV